MQLYLVAPGAGAVEPRRPLGPLAVVDQVSPFEWQTVDGVWALVHEDDHHGTPWQITHRPTGQVIEWVPSLDACREGVHPDGWALDRLRGEAVQAMRSDDAAERARGQRWIAVHMRLVGASNESVGWCVCGGILAVTSRTGSYGHLDRCPSCLGKHVTPALGMPCSGDHKFCGDPALAPEIPRADLTVEDVVREKRRDDV